LKWNKRKENGNMNEPIYNNIYDDWFIKEKIDGKIYLMARPSGKHIDVQGNIYNIFTNYFKLKKKKCIARIDAQLDINKDNYVVPDVMVFCHNNNKDIPLIVVEILSKSTWRMDLGAKMEKYAKIGIKEYWIVDCHKYIIDIYLLNDNKTYSKYETYVYYTDEDFSKIPKIREEQKLEIEIINEFSPVSMPEMKILLEDIFYFIEDFIEEHEKDE